MDGDRFDALSRLLASTSSRRQALKIAASGMVGGLLLKRSASPANAAADDVNVCYLGNRPNVPPVILSVSPEAAERLKTRRGYVVCGVGEELITTTCECQPVVGPGPCLPIGGSCHGAQVCCTGVCNPDNVCTCGVDIHCNGNSQCCSNNCVGGACICSRAGEACTYDEGCCGHKCVDGFCACSAASEACQANAQCCSGSCRNGACVCGGAGSICASDSACCGGSCLGGICACTAHDCPRGQTCHEGVCCTPNCTGKSCGSNGCGGTCGDCCDSGEQCEQDSECCSNVCQNGACGCTDGTCQPGETCFEGACCTPNCSARDECGDDGCGGSCGGGGCAEGQACQGRTCVLNSCPSVEDMSPYCTSNTCCFPPKCANAAGDAACFCDISTEAEVRCVKSGSIARCGSSSECPQGEICVYTCGGGNRCMLAC